MKQRQILSAQSTEFENNFPPGLSKPISVESSRKIKGVRLTDANLFFREHWGRVLFTLMLVSLLIFSGHTARAGDLVWVKGVGASGESLGEPIAVDGFGNTYVTGRIHGSPTFGSGEVNETSLTTEDGSIFVAKYNINGDLVWVKPAGEGIRLSSRGGIAVDGSGNIYVMGKFSGTATFGSGQVNETSFTAEDGSSDLFVEKLNASGDLIWVKRAQGARYIRGYGIAVDDSGNSYVTGEFVDTVRFGAGEANETTYTSVGFLDLFVAKFNASGGLVWAKRAGGANNGVIGRSIAVNGLGNAFVTGAFEVEIKGSVTFGAGETNETTLSASDNSTAFFIAKFNVDGDLTWVRRADAGLRDARMEGYDIAVDDSNQTYVTGYFHGSATFGSGKVNETLLTSGGGSFDLFVAKYNINGDLVWAKRAGGTGRDGVDGFGIAVDDSGHTYVTGSVEGTATFGSGEANETSLKGDGATFFLAKLNADGDLVWAKQSTGDDRGWGVAVNAGYAYVSGSLGGEPITFGPGEANETSLTTGSSGGLFVAKFATNASPVACTIHTDYNTGNCSGTFQVLSVTDLDAYLASDFGKNGGRNFKHLKIMADLTDPNLTIASPCKITVAKKVALTGVVVSLDGRRGVLNNNGYAINAGTACLLSKQGPVQLGNNSVVTVDNLTIKAAKTARIGKKSDINVSDALMLMSTGHDLSSNAMILAHSTVQAKTINLSAARRVYFDARTDITAEQVGLTSTGDLPGGEASLKAGATLTAEDLTLSAFRQAYLGRNSLLQLSGDLGVNSTGNGNASLATVKGANVTVGGNMALSSGNKAAIEPRTNLEVAGNLNMDAAALNKCKINRSARLLFGSKSGVCEPKLP